MSRTSLLPVLALVLLAPSCERHQRGELDWPPSPTPTTASSTPNSSPIRKPKSYVSPPPDPNMTDAFLIGVLSTIVAGILSAAGISIYRYVRMRTALLDDIRTELASANEAVDDLEKLINRFVAEGKTVNQSADYIITEYELFKALRTQLLAYFPARLGRITRFYRHLQEMEILIKRLYEELTEFKKGHSPLTKEDAAYLTGKFARIADMRRVLPAAKVYSLGQLPTEYGRQLTPAVMREFIDAIQQPAIARTPPKQLTGSQGGGSSARST
jgi:hypothetical protein